MNRRAFIKLAAASGAGLALGVRLDVGVEEPMKSEAALMRERCMACGSAMIDGVCTGSVSDFRYYEPGVIVAWNDEKVLLSTDEGMTWSVTS